MTPYVARVRTAFAVALLSVLLSACGYNTIPTLEEQAKAKWSDVQNNYQRRADLIPNLVATVQGYANQEKDVLTSVVEARAKATQITLSADDLTDPAKVKAFQDAQSQLGGALGRLLAISENYPDLKSNQNFLALQSQLEGTENRITVGAARLHRGGARLQHRAAHLPGRALGQDLLPQQQADGRVHRQRRRRDASRGEVLMR